MPLDPTGSEVRARLPSQLTRAGEVDRQDLPQVDHRWHGHWQRQGANKTMLSWAICPFAQKEAQKGMAWLLCFGRPS